MIRIFSQYLTADFCIFTWRGKYIAVVDVHVVIDDGITHAFADVGAGVTTPQGISIDTLIALLMHGESNCVTENELQNATDNEGKLPEESIPEKKEEAIDMPTQPEKPAEEIKPKKPKKGFFDRIRNLGNQLDSIFREDDE